MKKKAISLALALVMCLGLMAVPVSAKEEWNGDFIVDGDMVKHYYGDDSVVTVPSGYTTMDSTFWNCESVTSVTIPEGFITVGKDAFRGCTNLTSVTIPDSVTAIGMRTFSGCTGLTSVTIPSGVARMGDEAFSGCTSLTSITLPPVLTTIGNSEFLGCAGLTSITIPDSAVGIGDSAFRGCTGLTSVTIPDSVTLIGKSAFAGCTSLTSVTIPSSIILMSSEVFRGCTSLTSVTFLPGFKKSIGMNTFVDCTNLTSITIPSSVSGISNYAFVRTGLTDIYYGGTAAQWKAAGGPNALEMAKISPTVHYNSTGPSGTTTTQPTTPTQPQQPAASKAANPTNDSLEVNGKAASPTVYKIGDSNYFKIRDVAALLNGTEKQFAVGYDAALNSVTATTGQGYAKLAGDLAGAAAGGGKAADPSNDTIYVNGRKVEAEVYKIDGSNYFKLRDLGKALNFYVGWSAQRGMYIETDKPYTE